MNMITTIAIIGFGATIGASTRYYLTLWMTHLLGRDFPYGTLLANIIGSLIAGVLFVVILEKALLNETYRLMLLIGLTGSLTTMSALSLESMQMLNHGDYTQALLNIGLNIILSITFAVLGVIFARAILS